jgi:hypothetical protein
VKTFHQRLLAAQHGGNLTVADLARWFARPHPTVRQWVRRGVSPGGGPLDQQEVERRLTTLEKLVKAQKVLPLARMSPAGRIHQLEQIMDLHL